MSKLKNIKGFSDQFSDKLNLSKEQIQKIDDFEYNLYKEYHWSHRHPQPNFKLKFIRRIGRILTPEQWLSLKSFRDQSKEKIRTRENDRLIALRESQRKRFKDLSLDDNQVIQLVNLKLEIPNLIREERMKNPNREMDVEVSMHKLEREKYSQVLSSKQLLKYDEIIKEERTKKLKWLIKLSSERFEDIHKIKLNEEQREGVYLIEAKSPSYNKQGKIYSEFEQAELKLDSYKEVLNNQQFKIYNEYHQSLIINIKGRIIESDKRQEVYLDRLKKYFEFYKKNVLPKTTKSKREIEKILSVNQKQQLEILKSKYIKIVKENFEKSKTEFERFSKNLAVYEMEEFRIRMKLDLISPNGYYLKNFEPAKKFINVQLEKVLASKHRELEEIYDQFKKYQIQVYEETGGEYGGGWMTKVFPTEENIGKLGLLLLESNYEKNIERTIAMDDM